jgi:hypothetical protein
MVLVVPPEHIGGDDDHLIKNYMIDDDLTGMIGDCAQGDHVKVIAIANMNDENDN